MMTHTNKYSLGIYVNRNWAYPGGEGNPHVFLGLKKEKVKCNPLQIEIQKEFSESFLKYNMLEQAKEYEAKIKDMQCFIDEETLEDLRDKLNQDYPYSNDDDKEFKAWQDVSLGEDSFNKDFDKDLRQEFNNNFTFLRQCYKDITEPFFEWVKTEAKKEDTYIETEMTFAEFSELFDKFVKFKYNNLDSIEGFFGFGPYETGPFKNYENGNFITGGKVFQNNHWNDEFKEKTEVKYDGIKNKLKDKPTPRIPQKYDEHYDEYTDDKQYFTYSKDFTLTDLRPLKTFQEHQSEVIDITQTQYEEISKKILFDTLISSDKLRKNPQIFGNVGNDFKNYEVLGNSCVDFVMHKLQLIGASSFDKATAIMPYDVIIHIRNMKPNIFKKGKYQNPLSKGDKVSLLLYDIELYYSNFLTLCKIDSTWACEEGLKAFNQHCKFILETNLVNQKKLNSLTHHITNNQIEALPRNPEIDKAQDDISLRLNTQLYLYSCFEDRLKYYNDNFHTKVALIIYDKEQKQYLKADSQSNFIFNEFKFENIPSHNVALMYEQPILFEKNSYNFCQHIDENIFDEHLVFFTQSLIEEKKTMEIIEIY